MPKILYLICGLLLTVGCQSFNDSQVYNRQLQKWRGQSASELYADWGTPQQTVPLSGDSVMVSYYRAENDSSDNEFAPFDSDIYYNALTLPYYGIAPEPPLFYCETSFVIKDGIIVDYTFTGNNCD